MSRENEDDARIRREAARLRWETREALAWLCAAVPDDPELRANVHAAGALLFLQRQINRCEREAEARLVEAMTARAALEKARAELQDWRSLEADVAIDAERARHVYRAAEFRREHAAELDHAAHVWAWHNR